MTFLQRLFGSKSYEHTSGGTYLMPTPQDQVPINWLAQELAKIRDGVVGIREDVSAMSQDVKSLSSNQSRHETWLTKIDSDVTSLRGFPQKIDTVEKDVKELETSMGGLKAEIAELKAYRASSIASEATKKDGLGRTQQLITIFSILFSMGSTLLLAIMWLLSKLPPM